MKGGWVLDLLKKGCKQSVLIGLILFGGASSAISDELDSLEARNNIKFSFQYATSEAFENEALLLGPGDADYLKNYRYVDSFPEMKGSLKYTRYFNSGLTGSVLYEYSDLFKAPVVSEQDPDLLDPDEVEDLTPEDVKQHLFEGEVGKAVGDAFSFFFVTQMIRDSRGFNTYRPGAGAKLKLGSVASLSGEAHYFMRGDEAEDLGGEMNALNIILKYRQVMTSHMAFYFEYETLMADAKGSGSSTDGTAIGDVDAEIDSGDFTSHTLSAQLSSYFDSQTALHARVRYYHNTDIGLQSVAPSIKVDQYLGWATILSLKYRFYMNNNTNVETEELPDDDVSGGITKILDNDIKSHTVALQLKREITEDVSVYGRYQYYTNNFDIDMNIYNLGIDISF